MPSQVIINSDSKCVHPNVLFNKTKVCTLSFRNTRSESETPHFFKLSVNVLEKASIYKQGCERSETNKNKENGIKCQILAENKRKS